jgi:large subunit ribosomal protein L4
MAKIEVYDKLNAKTGEIELSDKVFSAPVNESLIYYAVKHYLARGRSGTASTKVRGEVQGSGKKLWRQKGTGRARVGDIRNPIWRGGGTVFGPKPRNYNFHFPKKMRYGALRAVLSKRFSNNQITVIENLEFEKPRTKEIMSMVNAFNVQGKFLVVDDIGNENLMLSIRNISEGKAVGGFGINIYDLLKCQNLFLTRKGVSQIEEVLGK